MTILTPWEFGKYSGRMRLFTMTILTPWYVLVALCMTFGTHEVMMFGRACSQQIKFTFMTRSTGYRRGIIRICNHERHMGLVTQVTVLLGHR
jgi:hypothetical protein